MATVTIPAAFEQRLASSDGSTSGGCPLERALQLDQSEVTNVYSVKDGQFKFAFQEHGTAYGETEASDYLVEASFGVENRPGSSPGFRLNVVLTPVEMWGINFAGSVVVRHESGEERTIYLPGTRTYDPAGITGQLVLGKNTLSLVCAGVLEYAVPSHKLWSVAYLLHNFRTCGVHSLLVSLTLYYLFVLLVA